MKSHSLNAPLCLCLGTFIDFKRRNRVHCAVLFNLFEFIFLQKKNINLIEVSIDIA